jgi:hypothetical protein
MTRDAQPPASRRLCVVADIERFSGRGNLNQLAIQGSLREVIEAAVGHAAIPWHAVETEDKGDGLLVQLPPDIDEPRVIPALVSGLSLALQRANAGTPPLRRIRLRVAITQGIRHIGPTGRIGDAVIAACRMVDCHELRAALARYPDRMVGVIVADDLYRDVIAHGYPGLDPAAFDQVSISIPEKRFTELAWTHVPEPASGALRRPPYDSRARRATAAGAGIAAAGAVAGGLIEAELHHHAAHEAAEPVAPDWDTAAGAAAEWHGHPEYGPGEDPDHDHGWEEPWATAEPCQPAEDGWPHPDGDDGAHHDDGYGDFG